MSKNLVVDVSSRAAGNKNAARRLRRGGQIPAIVYGEKKPSVPVAVDPRAIGRILASETGENTLFQLRLDGEEGKTRHVMIRDRQENPVTGALVHIDFIRVDMEKKVEVEVPVAIHGVAEGVKNEGCLMDWVGRSVHIRCLPVDIPDRVDVDVTPLVLGQVFRVKDLELNPRLEMLTDAERALVVISAPVKEEEVAAVAAEGVEEGEAAAAEGAEAAVKEEAEPEKK